MIRTILNNNKIKLAFVRTYHVSCALHVTINWFLKATFDMDSIIAPILWVRKLKHRENKCLSPNRKAE